MTKIAPITGTPETLRQEALRASIAALIDVATNAKSAQTRTTAAKALLVYAMETPAGSGERVGKKEAARRDAQTPDDSTPMGALIARRARQSKGP